MAIEPLDGAPSHANQSPEPHSVRTEAGGCGDSGLGRKGTEFGAKRSRSVLDLEVDEAPGGRGHLGGDVAAQVPEPTDRPAEQLPLGGRLLADSRRSASLRPALSRHQANLGASPSTWPRTAAVASVRRFSRGFAAALTGYRVTSRSRGCQAARRSPIVIVIRPRRHLF